MSNVTEKEQNVLNYIREVMDDYEGGFSDVEVDDLVAATGETTNTVKGLIGSLVQKELVFLEDVNGESHVFYLTSNGFDATES